jgi:anti-anti-sigma factor
MSTETSKPKGPYGHRISITIEQIERNSRGLLIHVQGELGTWTASTFYDEMRKQISKGYNLLVLDCSRLTWLGSLGVRALTAVLQQVKALEGSVILAALPNVIDHTIRALGFPQLFYPFFSIEESVVKALERLRDMPSKN